MSNHPFSHKMDCRKVKTNSTDVEDTIYTEGSYTKDNLKGITQGGGDDQEKRLCNFS